jgi:hypothetical protein
MGKKNSAVRADGLFLKDTDLGLLELERRGKRYNDVPIQAGG